MAARRVRLCVILGILGPAVVMGQTRPSGGIRGVVLDEAGNPIIGAVIRLLSTDATAPPLKTLRTGMDGTYQMKDLAPGLYRVRAEARGFLPVVHQVEIKPQMILGLDVELRRTGTLVEQREDRQEYRWSVRAARRHVLRFNKNGEMDDAILARAPERLRRGRIEWARGIGRRGSREQMVSFALVQEVSPGVYLAWAGQTNRLGGYPGRVEVALAASMSSTHALRAVVVASSDPTARQWALRMADLWQIAPSFSLIYGADVRRTQTAESQTWDVLPRVGLHWTLADHMRVKAELIPWSASEAHAGLTERGVALRPSLALRSRLEGEGHQWRIGIERALSERDQIEATFFVARAPQRGDVRRESEHHGVRVAYTRALGTGVRATVGYAFGRDHRHSSEGIAHAASARAFHLLAGRVDAILPRTRTYLAAHFRAARGWEVADPDPFFNVPPHVLSLLTTQLWERGSGLALPGFPTLDPGLTLVITQELPQLAFLPGRWEAIIEAHNLLLWSQEGEALFPIRASRTIRGSLALRF